MAAATTVYMSPCRPWLRCHLNRTQSNETCWLFGTWSFWNNRKILSSSERRPPWLSVLPLHLFTCYLSALSTMSAVRPLFQGINVIHRQPGQQPATGPRDRHSPFRVCLSRGASDCLKGHSFKGSPGCRAQPRPSCRELRRKWMRGERRERESSRDRREPRLRCSESVSEPPEIRLKT